MLEANWLRQGCILSMSLNTSHPYTGGSEHDLQLGTKYRDVLFL